MDVTHTSLAETTCAQHLRDLAMLCTNDVLELHLLPTEQCNFRCTYCYEDFSEGRMPPQVVRGVKRLIGRRADSLQLLSIAWFGGEPLAALGIVEDISEHACESAARHGFVFRGSMTTNAWGLTLETLKSLVALGVRDYQITLDGPAHLHDQVRRRADGAATFERIWSNLRDAHASALAFNINLRIHIRPDTADEVRRWLPELEETLLCDPRFKVLLKTVEHLGGPNDAVVRVYRNDREREAVVAPLYKRLGARGAFRNDIFARACYAGRPNAWVVRSNGDLARCTVALRDPANRVGRLTEDGELDIDAERLRPWFHGLPSLADEVLACPAKSLPR
jgi:uncharacterized protein